MPPMVSGDMALCLDPFVLDKGGSPVCSTVGCEEAIIHIGCHRAGATGHTAFIVISVLNHASACPVSLRSRGMGV